MKKLDVSGDKKLSRDEFVNGYHIRKFILNYFIYLLLDVKMTKSSENFLLDNKQSMP